MCFKNVSFAYISQKHSSMTIFTRKRFLEKTIAAFTDSTIFVLDFIVYYKACLVSRFGLETLDLEENSYSQFARKSSPRLQISARKANNSPTELSFPNHT